MDTAPIEIAAETAALRRATTCPPALRAAFERTGWRSVEPLDYVPLGASYAVVARRPAVGDARAASAIVFGFEGKQEVRLADLWGLLAEANTIRPDEAALCLGRGATISTQAAETAALLDIPVFRIAA